MLNYTTGDELLLNVPAINPSKPDEVLFQAGTKVLIDSIKDNVVNLKFPDGVVYQHEARDLPALFKKVSKNNVLSHTFSGVGTPPKGLFQFLPEGADWKKNYVWRISVELEERSVKQVICQSCTTEIIDFKNKNTAGYIYCTGCKEYITPLDLNTKQPWVDENAKEELIYDAVSKHSDI